MPLLCLCYAAAFFFFSGNPRAPLCVVPGGWRPAHWLRASHSAEAKSPSDVVLLPDHRLGLRLPSMMSIERRDTTQRTLSEWTGPLGASPDALLEFIELVVLVTIKLL